MTDYSPVTPRIYTEDEIVSARNILIALHEQCNGGKIDQHASPALLIAIDCLTDYLDMRANQCLEEVEE